MSRKQFSVAEGKNEEINTSITEFKAFVAENDLTNAEAFHKIWTKFKARGKPRAARGNPADERMREWFDDVLERNVELSEKGFDEHWYEMVSVGYSLMRDAGFNHFSVKRFLGEVAEELAAHNETVGIENPTTWNGRAGREKAKRAKDEG